MSSHAVLVFDILINMELHVPNTVCVCVCVCV